MFWQHHISKPSICYYLSLLFTLYVHFVFHHFYRWLWAPAFLVFYWRAVFGLLLSVLLSRWFLSCGNLKLPRPCRDSLASFPFAEASSLVWNPSHMAFLCLTSCCMTSFHCIILVVYEHAELYISAFLLSPGVFSLLCPPDKSLVYPSTFSLDISSWNLPWALQIVKLLFLRVSVSLTSIYFQCHLLLLLLSCCITAAILHVWLPS